MESHFWKKFKMSIQFFKRNTSKRGDGRELYYTPIQTIEKIIYNLVTNKPKLKNKLWIDPCAGDGRWGKVASNFGVVCESYDINPLSPNVKKLDFFKSNFDKDCFILGNPPFSQVKEFINKALSMVDTCYFLGGSGRLTGQLSEHIELLHRFEGYEGNQKDLRSKSIFIDTLGEEVLVWTVGGLFTHNIFNKFTKVKEKINGSFAVGIWSYCISDERVKIINK